MKKNYDVAIIGGGSAGYTAAIECSQRGLSTVCIEKRSVLGGTYLNSGCIPTKSLLTTTQLYGKMTHDGKSLGIEYSGIAANLASMMRYKENVVATIGKHIAALLKQNHVDLVTGTARIVSPFTVKIIEDDDEISADNIIVATGSEPTPLPFLDFDETYVFSSTKALALQEIPKRLIVIGAGATGLEMASIYNRLGSEVTVVEILDTIGAGCDIAMGKMLQQILVRQGISFSMATEVTRGKVGDGHVSLIATKNKQSSLLSADAVIGTIGRTPSIKNLGLEELGIHPNKDGFIEIDGNFRTAITNIYAIGDIIAGPMLASKASEEGKAVASIIAGTAATVNYLAIPNVISTDPEMASIGLTEQEAQNAGLDVIIGTAPFTTNPCAHCQGNSEGLVKIIGEKKSDRLIGMHILGSHASELIGEGVIAMKRKATVADLGQAVYAYPTRSEAIGEAARAAHKIPSSSS